MTAVLHTGHLRTTGADRFDHEWWVFFPLVFWLQ